MENIKTVKGRIQHKHGTEADWYAAGTAATPFCPLEGELIVYDPDAIYSYPRTKYGAKDAEGKLIPVHLLPFANSTAGENLGLVKTGGDVTISSGVISVNGNTPVVEVISLPVMLTKEENSKMYDAGNHFSMPFDYEIDSAKLVYGERYSGDFIDPTLDIADIEIIDAENDIHAFVLGPEMIGDITNDYNLTIETVHFYRHGTTTEYIADEEGKIIFGANNEIDVNGIRFSEGNLIIPARQGNLNEQPSFLIDLYLEWSGLRRRTPIDVGADIFDIDSDGVFVYVSINNNYDFDSPGVDDIVSLEGALKIIYNIGSDLRTESTTPYFNNLAANNLKPVTGDAIKPIDDAEYDLGSTDKCWNNIYARNFIGTAYKASNDEAGNNIVNTYATKSELNEVVAGSTPVRGTDYWTEEDKAEIKSYVDNAILNGAW